MPRKAKKRKEKSVKITKSQFDKAWSQTTLPLETLAYQVMMKQLGLLL